MKRMKGYYIQTCFMLLCLFSSQSCITEFEPKGADIDYDILVVDGFITDGVTTIELNRGVSLNEDFNDVEPVNDANLHIECDDGTQLSHTQWVGDGIYTIETGELGPDKKYRLHITWKDEEYVSSYLSPLITPDIDEVSYLKAAMGAPVFITVSTHDPKDQSRYYKWQYNEIWEFKTQLFASYGILNGVGMYFNKDSPNNIQNCWGRDNSKSMILESTTKLAENQVSNKKLIEMPPSDERLSILYYISVRQNQIRREAYNYFSIVQANIEQTGGIFGKMPFEAKGNIKCVNDPDRVVVGYVEVSTTTIKEQFMPELVDLYEEPPQDCGKSVTTDGGIPNYTLLLPGTESTPAYYAPTKCVDCTSRGSKDKPGFWPTDTQ